MSDEHGGLQQAQPVRPGDVYPPSAADHQARRERDRILAGDDAHDRQQQQQQQQRDGGGGGLRVTETDLPSAGKRVVTATAGGQVMAQFTVPVPGSGGGAVAESTDAVTIGEALQAAAQTSAGGKPVDLADAAAVQAAETRATGLGGVVPGGVAAAAQKAAETNMQRRHDKVPLRDVVGNAAAVLPANKVATRQDAEKVAAAAGRNAGEAKEGGGGKGVAEAVAAAAEMNEGRML